MKLFYFHDADGNFGDDMNRWIWDALLPGFRDWRDDTTLIGIGTILNTQLALPEGRKLVLGSGTGYGSLPELEPADMWDVRAVRGPLSAARLDLPNEKGIVDPAMMLPRLAEFSEVAKTGTKPLFIPHCSNDTRHDWVRICDAIGVEFVSPRGDARIIIQKIAEAPLVLAESMHAAIVADAFRTPWVALSVAGTVNKPKWMDWAESVKVDLNVVELFPELSSGMMVIRSLKKGATKREDSAQTSRRLASGQPRSLVKRLRLRSRYLVERIAIKSRLKRTLLEKQSLSEQSVLTAKQDAFQKVLYQTQADYSDSTS